jgi:hypothetical protein
MPKGKQGLEPDVRKGMLRELVGAIFRDAAARGAAFSYFAEGMRSLPVHDLPALSRSIQVAATGRDAAVDEKPPAYPPMHKDTIQYTPGLAATAAFAGLRACKAAGRTAAELERCVERAIAPSTMVHGASR